MLAAIMRVLVDNSTLAVVSLQPEKQVQASLSLITALQSFLMVPMQLGSGTMFTHFKVIVLMIATSILWLLDGMAARQFYASELYASLRQGHLDSTSSILDFTPDQIQLVKETLVNGEPSQAHFVLNSLSHKHIASYAQEFRALFYKKDENGVSLTPLHTKLRLLNLHTAAKSAFVLNAEEYYFLPEAKTFPAGIFNTIDFMMLVNDKSGTAHRQLRVAATLACGYEKFSMNAGQCVEMLHKILGGEDDKSITVCSAVALLRLYDWIDEEANDILQRLLHEEKVRLCSFSSSWPYVTRVLFVGSGSTSGRVKDRRPGAT
ncbi:hypothetical protein PsorP6_008594 [Peronosclerospora sorghi]|uniref:Uncharacterized protein n=1 Tax=Peronosclerospora sorghi TaxID=230839 RepID=A0ACC0W9X9_9STRA|nr:hypothetical protein PsorP6_008594 [Peronosclerospora sorghi]